MEKSLLTPEESRIHEQAQSRAKKYLECEAQLLDVIEEIDRRCLFEKFGLRSTFAYCTERLRLSEATAYNFISVCRKSRKVPELKAAIDEGRLSVAKARKIVAVINEQNHSEWIDKAASLTQAQLERCVADAAPAAPVRERAKPCGHQLVKLELALTVTEFEAFERARDVLSQKRGSAATIQQAVAAQTELYLERLDPLRKALRRRAREDIRKLKPSIAKQKAQAMVVTAAAAVAGVARPEAPALRRNLSQEQLKRRPLPAAVKGAVDLRDGRKCQACGSTRWIHYHHRVPLAAGGDNTPENLVTLCSSCHRREHAPYQKRGVAPSASGRANFIPRKVDNFVRQM